MYQKGADVRTLRLKNRFRLLRAFNAKRPAKRTGLFPPTHPALPDYQTACRGGQAAQRGSPGCSGTLRAPPQAGRPSSASVPPPPSPPSQGPLLTPAPRLSPEEPRSSSSGSPSSATASFPQPGREDPGKEGPSALHMPRGPSLLPPPGPFAAAPPPALSLKLTLPPSWSPDVTNIY